MSPSVRYGRPRATPLLAAGLTAVWVGLHLMMELSLGQRDPARLLGSSVLVAGLGAAFAAFLHQRSGRLRRRREVTSLFMWIAVGTLGARALVPVLPSPVWLPLAAFVLPLEPRFDRSVPVVVGALLAAAVAPLSPVLATTTLAQSLTLTYALRDPTRSAWHWLAPVTGLTIVAGLTAAGATELLVRGALTLEGSPSSTLVAAAGSGVGVGLLGVGLSAVLERMLGNLSRTQLLELSDLRNPLLQRIATRAPGSWQHSRMMANLAESAAHAVNADALLVRVGAYYHDLGKADEPQFFIENGVRDAHEPLTPRESAAKIIQHVVGGVQRGREAGLPEDIIDFMHTHHGSSRVEYFWQQALRESMASGSPPPDAADFTYPGVPPMSRETAILALVDAIEAAARTLPSADRVSVERMLRQILFTKLDAGQLDHCGLTARDLHGIVESLVESLMASAHERITYPWQDAEAEAEAPEAPVLHPDASDGHIAPEDDESSVSLRVLPPDGGS